MNLTADNPLAVDRPALFEDIQLTNMFFRFESAWPR
jgi:hypothetical protein